MQNRKRPNIISRNCYANFSSVHASLVIVNHRGRRGGGGRRGYDRETTTRPVIGSLFHRRLYPLDDEICPYQHARLHIDLSSPPPLPSKEGRKPRPTRRWWIGNTFRRSTKWEKAKVALRVSTFATRRDDEMKSVFLFDRHVIEKGIAKVAIKGGERSCIVVDRYNPIRILRVLFSFLPRA